MTQKHRILGVDYADDVEHATGQGDPPDIPLIEAIADHAAQAVMTHLAWRVSCVGRLTYPTKVGSVLDGHNVMRPTHKPFAQVMQRCDPVVEAVRAAHERGMKLWFYMTLFDECYQSPTEHISESWLGQEHPEYYLKHARQDGLYIRGVFSLAYQEVREYFLGIVKEGLDRGCDAIYLDCGRTHAGANPIPVHGWWPQWTNPFLAYGYNEPDVQRYRSRYGKEPPYRHWTTLESMEPTEEELNWNRVRGEALTDFIREVRPLAQRYKTPIVVSFYPPTYNGFNPGYHCREMLGRYYIDWQTWVKEGLIDAVRLIVDHRKFGYDDWVANSAHTYAEAQKAGVKVYIDCCLGGSYDKMENPPAPLPIRRSDNPQLFDELRRNMIRNMLKTSADGIFYYEHAGGDDTTWPLLRAVHEE